MTPHRRASREAHLESSAALASGVDPRDARRASRRVALELLARDPELARVAQVSPNAVVRAARKAGVQEADANDSELIRDIAEVADRYARAAGVGGKIPTITGGVGGSRGAPGPRKPRGIPDGLDPRGGGLRDYLDGGGLGRGGDGGLGGWDRSAKYLPGASDGRGALIDLAPPDRHVRSIIGPGDAGDLDARIDGVLDALGLPPQRRNRSAVDEAGSRKRRPLAHLGMGAWNRFNPGAAVSADPDSGGGDSGDDTTTIGEDGGGGSGRPFGTPGGGGQPIQTMPSGTPMTPDGFGPEGRTKSPTKVDSGPSQAAVNLVYGGAAVGALVGAVRAGGAGAAVGVLAGAGVGYLAYRGGRAVGWWHRPSDDDSGTGPAGPRARAFRPADDDTGPVGPWAANRMARSVAVATNYMPAPDGTGPVGPWSRFGGYGKPAPDDPNPGGPAGRSLSRPAR